MKSILKNSNGNAVSTGGKLLGVTEGYVKPTGTLEITENGTQDVTNYAIVNVNVASSGEDMLQARVDSNNSCDYLLYGYKGTNVDFIKNLDMSNVTSAMGMFEECKNLIETPPLYFAKVDGIGYLFRNCKKLVTIGELDFRSVRSAFYVFDSCALLTNLTLKNININLKIGSGTSWGHLLTLDSLVNTIKELVNDGTSQILTMGSANLEKIANIYVRRTTEGDIPTCLSDNSNIDLAKAPCEVCNETDEGAMLITAYANLKNWSLA